MQIRWRTLRRDCSVSNMAERGVIGINAYLGWDIAVQKLAERPNHRATSHLPWLILGTESLRTNDIADAVRDQIHGGHCRLLGVARNVATDQG